MKTFLLLTATTLFLQFAYAQYIENGTSQQSASFNISGKGLARAFQTAQVTGAGGNGHFRMTQAGNQSRWAIGMNTEETGGANTGSNFSLYAYLSLIHI